MKFKFEKLIIWQKSMDFGEAINGFANRFPTSELYNLSSQIRRAADSIALNISEGSIGQSNPEFKKFYGIRNSFFSRSCYMSSQSKKKRLHN